MNQLIRRLTNIHYGSKVNSYYVSYYLMSCIRLKIMYYNYYSLNEKFKSTDNKILIETRK